MILVIATWLSLFLAPLSAVFSCNKKECRVPGNPEKLICPGFELDKRVYVLFFADILWCIKVVI